ncbi:MAG: M18 family aminopeptidase [Acidimicrobiales bacterium]
MADADALDLLAFIAASPSPFHAVEEAARRLEAAGFRRLDDLAAWRSLPGGHVVVRGGTLVAWATGEMASPQEGFRLIGAHTDSPNLRIKPRPDTGSAGWRQLGVEVYGGALRNSWLDRDLGLSGRVAVRTGDATAELRLFRRDEPLLRVPQLAIHLDRTVNDGLVLNAQQHLTPVWGLGPPDEGGFARFLAAEVGCGPGDVLGWDAMAHDLAPGAALGREQELLSVARLDNLLSCWAAVGALVEAADAGAAGAGPSPVICLFDHEEVGSESATGAASSMLPTVLERIAATLDGGREDFHRGLAASVCVSADGAHATHPNYPERHEPGHQVAVNGGPVLKHNANVRYATDAATAAVFKLACERANVPFQEFVVRSDLPCGSTIGPITAARLGIPTVDVGVAQLSMHSARELCGAEDPGLFRRALTAFLTA